MLNVSYCHILAKLFVIGYIGKFKKVKILFFFCQANFWYLIFNHYRKYVILQSFCKPQWHWLRVLKLVIIWIEKIEIQLLEVCLGSCFLYKSIKKNFVFCTKTSKKGRRKHGFCTGSRAAKCTCVLNMCVLLCVSCMYWGFIQGLTSHWSVVAFFSPTLQRWEGQLLDVKWEGQLLLLSPAPGCALCAVWLC